MLCTTASVGGLIEKSDGYNQWRSYTRAHTGPGPGEFLSALVNHVRSTYLNHNSVAACIYRIMSCRIKLPMPLRPGKLDLLFRISHLLDLRAGGAGGHYSLFVTSKCYTRSANPPRYSH